MSKYRDLLFGIALGASVCLNVILLTGSWGDRSSTRGSQAGVATPPIGSVVEPIPVQTRGGTSEVVDYRLDERSTVLYVIHPSCSWCRRNTENIRALAANTGDRFRFVGLSTSEDGLHQYLADHPLGFDVKGTVRTQDLQTLGFVGTPFTAVVASDGRLLASWRGAYGGPSVSEIEKFFGLTLPGLASVPSAD